MNSDRYSDKLYIKSDKQNQGFLIFIVFFYAVIFMTNNCFSSALVAIVKEGTMTKTQTGLMTSGFYLFYGALQIFGGVLADKYNPKTILKIGLLLSAFINGMIFFFNGFHEMLILWSLNGAVQMANYHCVFKILTTRLAPSWRKQGIFYISFTGNLGLVFGYVIAAFVTKWQYNFLVSSLSILLMVVALDIAFKSSSVQLTLETDAVTNKESCTEVIPKWSVLKLFAVSGFLGILPVFLFRTFSGIAINTYTASMLMESYSGLGITVSNLLSALVNMAGIIGTVLVKWYTNRRKLKNEIRLMSILFVVTLPFICVLFLIGKVHAALIILSVCIVSAILNGILLLCSFVAGYFTRFGKSGIAAGAYNAASSAGVMLQSYSVGFTADNLGWMAVVAMYCAIGALCVIITISTSPVWGKFKNRYA